MHQMAVPNHPPAGYAHQQVTYAPIPPGYGPPVAAASPRRRRDHALPGVAARLALQPRRRGRDRPRPRPVGHEAYPTPRLVRARPPHGPRLGGAQRGLGAGGGAERTIRPAVPSPLSSNGAARATATAGAAPAATAPAMPGDDLGIEESEYDTPAYLRRARGLGSDYGGGYRMPGEK